MHNIPENLVASCGHRWQLLHKCSPCDSLRMKMPHGVQAGGANRKQVHQMSMVGNHLLHLHVFRPFWVLPLGPDHQPVSVFEFGLRRGRLKDIHIALVIVGFRAPPRPSKKENSSYDDTGNRHDATLTPHSRWRRRLARTTNAFPTCHTSTYNDSDCA